MARINIEDSLWKNPGFQDFMITCGSRKLAKAHILEAFEAAQKYWFPDQKPVPEYELVSLDIPVDDLIKCRLAERRDGGIYIKGSEGQFSWLFERRDAGSKGGKKSAERERDEKGHFRPSTAKESPSSAWAKPKQSPSSSKQSLDNSPSKPKQTQASISSSISISSSSSSSNSNSNSNSSSAELPKEDTPASTETKRPQSRGALNEFQGDEDLELLLGTVTHKAQQLWLKTYPDADWIRQEFLSALSWCEANPKKRPKSDYAKFLGGWLRRGWESHRKAIPSTQAFGRKSKAQETTNNLMSLWQDADKREKAGGDA